MARRRYDPPDGWKEPYESKLAAYSDTFLAVDLNRTFYELPQVSTAERWRDEVVDNFVFAVKAWQGVTHRWACLATCASFIAGVGVASRSTTSNSGA